MSGTGDGQGHQKGEHRDTGDSTGTQGTVRDGGDTTGIQVTPEEALRTGEGTGPGTLGTVSGTAEGTPQGTLRDRGDTGGTQDHSGDMDRGQG